MPAAGRLLLASGALVQAQGGGVTFERLLNAAAEPHNWLTYSGGYHSNRHTTLDGITPENVDDLEVRWVFQAQSLQVFQTTPLVVDGVMYITEAPNTVVALDAKHGRVFWRYEYTPALTSRPCCGRVNRGVAILGDTLYMGTIDAQLIAIDTVSGKPIWMTAVGDPEDGHALTLAPLIVKDKVIVGIAGGEFGIRGFISAYDAASGEEVWKFYTIPGPGEPGHETWENDAWRTGGAPAWLTGSYDAVADLIYWGTGNPGPDWNPASAPATTCTPRRWWRSTPTRASWPGTSSSRRTIRTTTTRYRCRCWWTTRRRAAARCRSCSGPTATASSTCSTARPGASSTASPTCT